MNNSASEIRVTTAGNSRGLGRRPGPVQGYSLIIASCMPALGAVLIAPVLPSMAGAFGSTPGVGVLIPLILTIPALMIAVTSSIAGIILDRLGRKKVLLTAMILYAGFGTAPLWLDSLLAILISRAGLGICEAFILTGCLALTAEYFQGPEREKYIGYQAGISTLAATVFLLVGGLMGQFGWRAPFWLYGISLLIGVALLFVIWEPERRAEGVRKVPTPWRLILVPCLVTLFGGLVFFTVVVHMPFVLTALGMADPAAIGLASAVTAFAGAIASFGFRAVARLGVTRLLTIAFSIAGIGFIVVWFAPAAVGAVAGAAIANFGAGLMLPTLVAWMVGRLPREHMGAGSGALQTSLWIGQFSTSIIIGAVAAALGGRLDVALGLLGLACLLAAALTALLLRTGKAPWGGIEESTSSTREETVGSL